MLAFQLMKRTMSALTEAPFQFPAAQHTDTTDVGVQNKTLMHLNNSAAVFCFILSANSLPMSISMPISPFY
jgi:hypothetical protein